MDTKMVGSFLKKLRKENNMTQEQLGERIGVTNKTVSRWETGNYMPPVESLILLSDIYGISINEILAGKRLEMDELKEVADENVTKVLGELEAINVEGSPARRGSSLAGIGWAVTLRAVSITSLTVKPTPFPRLKILLSPPSRR